MTQKIMLPMAPSAGREYVVTVSEQKALAGRYGMKTKAICACLFELRSLMEAGEIQPQKTGNKTKAIIAAHIESSNVTERQGALANGPQVGLHPYKPRHGMPQG